MTGRITGTGTGADLTDDEIVGSGNVFEDLGFANPGLEDAKASLVLRLEREIVARNLTQTEAGKIIGLKQPKLSALLRGHWERTSLDRLLTFLTRLGLDVSVNVTGPGQRQDNGIQDASSRPDVEPLDRAGRIRVAA